MEHNPLERISFPADIFMTLFELSSMMLKENQIKHQMSRHFFNIIQANIRSLLEGEIFQPNFLPIHVHHARLEVFSNVENRLVPMHKNLKENEYTISFFS
jgi:hypothetical protein